MDYLDYKLHRTRIFIELMEKKCPIRQEILILEMLQILEILTTEVMALKTANENKNLQSK